MNKIRILIADDVEMALDGLLGFITPEPDMEVVGTAYNGEELLQLLAQRPGEADLLLVDVNMPKLNGLKTIAKIRESDRNIKILVMTMFSDRNFMVQAVQYEANGFISKNRGRKEFVEAIRRVYNGETVVMQDNSDGLLPSPRTPPPVISNLDPIELRVIRLMIGSKKNHEIATVLKFRCAQRATDPAQRLF